MKLLILCGQLYPTESNNTKLLSKLLPFLQNGNELHLVLAVCRFAQVRAVQMPVQRCLGVAVGG